LISFTAIFVLIIFSKGFFSGIGVYWTITEQQLIWDWHIHNRVIRTNHWIIKIETKKNEIFDYSP
jgi:hypothetical protein